MWINRQLSESRGELTEELEKWIDETDEDIETKVGQLIESYHQSLALSKIQADESDRLKRLSDEIEGFAEGIKRTLGKFMDDNELGPIVTAQGSVSVKDAGGYQAMEFHIDPDEAPVNFQKRGSASIDAKKVREYLDSGGTLDWVEILPRKRVCVIK